MYGKSKYSYKPKKNTKAFVPKAVKTYVAKKLHTAGEDKFTSGLMTGTWSSVGNTWVEKDLTEIAQGTASNQRVGDWIRCKKIGFNGVIVGAQTNTMADDARNIMRIVVAEWDGRITTPLATNAATINDIIRKDEITGKGLVRLLYDKVVLLTPPGKDSTGYMPAQKYLKVMKKVDKVIKYASATSTEAQTRIIVSMISDSAGIPNPGFVTGKYEIHYNDQ